MQRKPGATQLRERRCKPCEGGVDALSESEARDLLGSLHDDWLLSKDHSTIRRDIRFAGFNRTMGFVNAVAWIASTEGHHPNMQVSYGQCVLEWTTRAINGLSANDFICAAKVDQLLEAIE